MNTRMSKFLLLMFTLALSLLAVADENDPTFKEILSKAENGSVDMQYLVGIKYTDFGDEVKAMKWFRKCAESGEDSCQYMVGMKYEFGKGVAVDQTEANNWYLKSTYSGNRLAPVRLGARNVRGIGGEKNIAQAVQLFSSALARGNLAGLKELKSMNGEVLAQFKLGELYRGGVEALPRDDAEAAIWFRKAAEQGHAGAQNQLAYMYFEGEGVEQSDAEAAKWYLLSAKQGKKNSQEFIAWLYENGRGVPKDLAEAARWARLAAEAK